MFYGYSRRIILLFSQIARGVALVLVSKYQIQSHISASGGFGAKSYALVMYCSRSLIRGRLYAA